MERFGIARGDGFCVALESGGSGFDHAYFSAEMKHYRGLVDIDEIFEAHRKMYVMADHPEWVREMSEFLKSRRETIVEHYAKELSAAADKASFGKRFKRVLAFLDSL
jgi:hypothetical protein